MKIDRVELMARTNNFTAGYAEAMILGTPKDQLTDPDAGKSKQGMSAEQIARMEEEMAGTVREFKAITDIKKLLDNAKVVRFLNANYSDVLTGLESMMAAETL